MVTFKYQCVEDKSTVHLYILYILHPVCTPYFVVLVVAKRPTGGIRGQNRGMKSGGPRGGSTKLIGAELKSTWPLCLYGQFKHIIILLKKLATKPCVG